MQNANPQAVSSAANEPCALGFDDFLAKLPAKDRASVQRRIAAAADAPPDGGLLELWRRLASALFTLAPHAAKMSNRQADQYSIADGKYRMKEFALEDLQDGNLTIYCPDVMSNALDGGLLVSPIAVAGSEDLYGVAGTSHVLTIRTLDRSTIDPATYFKDMVGWNRRALRITLPAAAPSGQITAAEALCAIAAQRFHSPAAAS
jgi:hypothetical protein